MVENKSSLFGIIAIIIGATSLGIGTFSVINFQIVKGQDGLDGIDGVDGADGVDGINGTQGVPGSIEFVVGIWENLTSNKQYSPYDTNLNWLIRVDDFQVNNSNFFTLSRNNTRFHLNKSGWYRVNMILLLFVMTAGESYTWGMSIFKNGLEILRPRLISNVNNTYQQVDISFYVSSDGTDYYDFSCQGSINFYIHTNQIYNQLGIEYLGEY